MSSLPRPNSSRGGAGRRRRGRGLTGRAAIARAFLAAVALMGLRLEAADTLSVKTNFYAVAGSTLGELWHSQAQQRPWKSNFSFAARTRWDLKWKFRFAVEGERYRVEGFELRTEVLVILPRWLPPAEAEEAVVSQWTRYVKALMVHEAGHVAIAQQAAAEIRRQIDGLPTFASAAELRDVVGRTAEEVQNNYRQREREYDQRTRHGATQGAWLPYGGGQEGRGLAR
jgi:predicted secreted Zn-dependent protease